MNHLIFIKKQLYILKRQYGKCLDIYASSENGGPDLTTGKRNLLITKYHIKKGIVLPLSMVAQGLYNQAFMKNIGREYAYGNILETEMKTVIIDAKDLPSGVILTTDNYVIFNHNRYEIMKVEALENNYGYTLVIKRLLGVPAGEIFDLSITQEIRFIERQSCQ